MCIYIYIYIQNNNTMLLQGLVPLLSPSHLVEAGLYYTYMYSDNNYMYMYIYIYIYIVS